MTAAAVVCGSCGTELPPNSKFCNECGAAVATATTPAEYKRVTVLFADVVHSMDIAAVFGAPAALEDHALRRCLAALGIRDEAKRVVVEVDRRDGVDLQLRVGLNSGQVIAGEIGSGPFSYTAVGEQLGMAERIESVAPPGGLMLSESTARLVDGAATLGEFELVQIEGVES